MRWLVRLLVACCKPRTILALENLCLRQQLAVLARRQPRPALQNKDRRFWVLMCRWFDGWRECLVLATPETVLAWHRRGWRHYWRRKTKTRRSGRRRIAPELRQLIRRMAAENPLWGQVRIMAELLKLGYVVSPRTVRRYMRRPWSGKPSPRWRDFLRQHAKDIWRHLGMRFSYRSDAVVPDAVCVLSHSSREPGDYPYPGDAPSTSSGRIEVSITGRPAPFQLLPARRTCW